MAKVIAVANEKGGVAKTTTTVNLAYKLAVDGFRILVVDMDVQGHAATSLGLPKGDGLYRLLAVEDDEDAPDIRKIAVKAREGITFDLVTSNKKTEKLKVNLTAAQVGREHIAERLEGAGELYDFIFLDLAPSSDILHIGCLVASDYYIIPATMDHLALDGVFEIKALVDSLGKYRNVVPPELIGVLPTKWDRVTNETSENFKIIAEKVKRVLPPILSDTHVREASARGLTIWEYAPDSPAVIGYKNGTKAHNSRDLFGGYLHLVEIIKSMMG